MHAPIIVYFMMIMLSSVCYAHAGKDYEPETRDSVYFQKYGQKGLDHYNDFMNALSHRETPYYTETTSFNAQKPVLHTPSGDDFFKPVSVDMPALNNSSCVNNGEMTLTNTTNIDYYKLKQDNKMYDVRVEKTICYGAIYQTDEKTLREPYDGDGFSYLRVYINNIRLLTVLNAADYGIYKSEIIVPIGKDPINLGSAFSRYNWADGKEIETDSLEISLDDVPSIDPAMIHAVVLPDGTITDPHAPPINNKHPGSSGAKGKDHVQH